MHCIVLVGTLVTQLLDVWPADSTMVTGAFVTHPGDFGLAAWTMQAETFVTHLLDIWLAHLSTVIRSFVT